MSLTLPGSGAIALYLLATIIQLARWHSCTQGVRYLITALTALALLLHGLVALQMVSAPAGANLSLFAAVALFTWMLAGLTWCLSLYRPLMHLFILTLPISIISLALIFSQPDLAQADVRTLSGQPLWLHAIPSLAAYAVVSICCFQSMLVFFQERQLHSQNPFRFTQALPPLLTMESLLFQLLKVSIVLLGLAVLSGFIFLEDMFAQRLAHHTVLSLLAWLVLAILLWGRSTYGWRGRTAAKWIIASFALLLLAYFGAKLVIEIILKEVG